jgi:hypothetical protein
MTIDRTNGTVTLTSEEMSSIKAINAASRAEAMEQVGKIINCERKHSAKYNMVKATNDIHVDETMIAVIRYSKGKVKSIDFLDADRPFFAIVKIK